MTSTTITAGQSLLDVALQEYGSVDALFALADANGLAVTDPLTAGQELVLVPVPVGYYVGLGDYFRRRKQRLNTGDVPPAPPLPRAPRYFSSSFFKPDYFA